MDVVAEVFYTTTPKNRSYYCSYYYSYYEHYLIVSCYDMSQSLNFKRIAHQMMTLSTDYISCYGTAKKEDLNQSS